MGVPRTTHQWLKPLYDWLDQYLGVPGHSHAGYVMYPAPIAAELITIVADVAVADGALTIAAQPAVPCKLQVRKVDGDSSFSCTVALVGKGPAGEAVTESIAFLATDGTHTYTTANAFSHLTSATVSLTTGNGGTDHISIGQSAALGLPIPSGAGSVSVYKAAVGATSTNTPVDEAVGTVDATARTIIPTTAPNGTKAFHVWYNFDWEP
jgi:hypothetical protein